MVKMGELMKGDQIRGWGLCFRSGAQIQVSGSGLKHDKMGKNGEKSYKTGEDVASSVKLLYLRILYRCIASKNRFLN